MDANRNRNIILAAVVGCIALLAGLNLARSSQESRPKEIPFDLTRRIAEEELPSVIPGATRIYRQYFNTSVDFTRATLGDPVVGYYIDMAMFADQSYAIRAFQSNLAGGTVVCYPMLVDQKPLYGVFVGYANDTWKFMSAGTGVCLDAATLPIERDKQSTTERTDVIVFGPAWAVFGYIQRDGEDYLIPVSDSFSFFPELSFGTRTLYRASEVVPLLHAQSARYLAEYKEPAMIDRPQPTAVPTPVPPPIITSEPYPRP